MRLFLLIGMLRDHPSRTPISRHCGLARGRAPTARSDAGFTWAGRASYVAERRLSRASDFGCEFGWPRIRGVRRWVPWRCGGPQWHLAYGTRRLRAHIENLPYTSYTFTGKLDL